MNEISRILKLSMLRVFFNIPIGIFGIEIFHWIIKGNGILIKICSNGIQLDKCSIVNSYCILIYLLISIFIGEIFALIGEFFLNILFDYSPIFEPEYMEKISPFKAKKNYCRCEINNKDNEYIKYKQFVETFNSEAISEMSEVHFVFSRILSGFSVILFIFGLSINFYGIVISIIMFSFLSILLNVRSCKKGMNIFISTVLIFFLGGVILTKHFKCADSIWLPFIPLSISIFTFLKAIDYRTHGNILIVNLERKKNKKTNKEINEKS